MLSRVAVTVTLLFLALAGPLAPVQAVSFGAGAKGGVNFGNAAIDDIDEVRGRTGTVLGAFAEIGIMRPVGLTLEALWVQTGAEFDVGPVFEAGAELTYVEIPILAKARFGRTDVHAYLFAGPSFAFNLTAEGDFEGAVVVDEDDFSAVDVRGEIGAGGAARVAEFIYLVADIRYSHGFLNALEDPVAAIDSWYTRDIRLMGGILFHLTE